MTTDHSFGVRNVISLIEIVKQTEHFVVVFVFSHYIVCFFCRDGS